MVGAASEQVKAASGFKMVYKYQKAGQTACVS